MASLAGSLNSYEVDARYWMCIACGAVNEPVCMANTESFPCTACGATWRDRVLLAAVLTGLAHGLFPIPSLAVDSSRTGIGVADGRAVAGPLSSRFDYVNGHLHRYPRLDLRDVASDLNEWAEFVTCAEVLEHVEPPVEAAISGLASLIKPGGFLVVTVPAVGLKSPGEYYPGLVSWSHGRDGSVSWVDADGGAHRDDDPEWHGGEGLTLAFRLWTEESLDQHLRDAGLHVVPEGPIFRDDLGTPPLPGKLVRVARKVA